MATGSCAAAAVQFGMTTEFQDNIYSFYYVLTILQGLPTLQRQQLQQRQRQRQQQQRQRQRQQRQQRQHRQQQQRQR